MSPADAIERLCEELDRQRESLTAALARDENCARLLGEIDEHTRKVREIAAYLRGAEDGEAEATGRFKALRRGDSSEPPSSKLSGVAKIIQGLVGSVRTWQQLFALVVLLVFVYVVLRAVGWMK